MKNTNSIPYWRIIQDTQEKIVSKKKLIQTNISPEEKQELRTQIQTLRDDLKSIQKQNIEISNSHPQVKTAFWPRPELLLANDNSKITLMLQYYDEPNIERRNELLRAIDRNICNKIIDDIVIFLEISDKTRSFEELKADIDVHGNNFIAFVPLHMRLTYTRAIEYAEKHGDGDTVFLVCNNDCYFNNTVELLKKIDFRQGRRLVCLTRKDELPDGKIVRAKSPKVWDPNYKFDEVHAPSRDEMSFLDYGSSDAWAFTDDIKKYKFESNYQLGTFNCEYNFHEQAHLAGIDLRNPCEFIDCIHIHNTYFRRESALSNEKTKKTINRMLPTETSPRSSKNWIHGTWRLRNEYNYIDKDSEFHEYSEYVVSDFLDICKTPSTRNDAKTLHKYGHFYSVLDNDVVDYEVYSPMGEDSWPLRGPKPTYIPEDFNIGEGSKIEKYITCIGSAHTFGRFCEKPFPVLLQERLNVHMLNLGKGGAGPGDYIRKNNEFKKRLFEVINKSAGIIIQVMPGRSESNSLFESSGTRGVSKITGENIDTVGFWKQLMATENEKKIQELVNETRKSYIATYVKLFKRIEVPKILFYFSTRTPDYEIELNSQVNNLFGEFPQLVNLDVVNELRKHCEYYVESVTSRGSPAILKNRFTGEPINDYIDYGFRSWKKYYGFKIDPYYPSPEMHEDATEKLLPVCNQVIVKSIEKSGADLW
tara:strand:+ start:4750 stop:6858 length:2109 start_codon:yes stop_codon:yes gene_type:complete